MIDAFICDAVRTPFGRYDGILASIRADDLAHLGHSVDKRDLGREERVGRIFDQLCGSSVGTQ